MFMFLICVCCAVSEVCEFFGGLMSEMDYVIAVCLDDLLWDMTLFKELNG